MISFGDFLKNIGLAKLPRWSADGNSLVGKDGVTSYRLRPGGQVGIACSKAGVMGGISGVFLAANGANSAGTSDGVSTGATSYITYRSPSGSAISDLQVEFWNGHISAIGETAGLNPITINASLQVNGVVYPIMSGGALLNIAALAANAKVLSDVINVVIPANTSFAIKQSVSVASVGMTWPVGRKPGTGEGVNGGYSGITGPDTSQTLGATGITAAVNGMFGPSNIIGTLQKNQGAVLLVGDSKLAGTGEAGADAFGQIGYAERAFGNTIPWFTSTRGSTRLSDFNAAHDKRFSPYAKYCTVALFNLCTNDIWSDGANLAQMQARFQAAWANASARGLKVVQCTCGPQTVGTWDTLAGQTIIDATKEANRVATNEWLRTVPPGCDAIIDTADVEESSRNSGKWRVDLGGPATTDGLHDGGTYMVPVLVALVQSKINLFL